MHAAARRNGNRPVIGMVLAVLAVVVVLAAVALVIISSVGSTPNRAAVEAPSAPANTLPSTPTSTPARPTTLSSAASSQPPVTARPAVASALAKLAGRPLAPLPETGPGITKPGILLVASPAPDGSFDVLERIRLSSPVSVLTLRPAAVGRAGQQFAAATAAATEVQVNTRGKTVAVPLSTIDALVNLPVTPGDQFELRYRLTDVAIRSTPSTAGRALAAIGPLTGGVDDDLPVLFIVSGGTVLGLNCPLLPLSQQSCGSRVQTRPNIEHELPWQLALTTVQLNLPPA